MIFCLADGSGVKDEIGCVKALRRDIARSRELSLMVCSASNVVEDRTCQVGGGTTLCMREEGRN